MAFVSVTRLRLRGFRYLPRFTLLTVGAFGQVKRAEGFRGGSTLLDRDLTFWTMTLWIDQAAMRRYMTSGSHKKAMPFLLVACDEASVTHWIDEGAGLPSWHEATTRMRGGRASKIHFPSPNHADLSYRDPRLSRAAPIEPKRSFPVA